MKNYKLDENGRLSQEDVERFKILRNKQHEEIVRSTGAGKSTVINILKGITSVSASKSVRGLDVLAAAEGLLKVQQEIEKLQNARR